MKLDMLQMPVCVCVCCMNNQKMKITIEKRLNDYKGNNDRGNYTKQRHSVIHSSIFSDIRSVKQILSVPTLSTEFYRVHCSITDRQ